MSAGRNDPCPCGSGKKYKHCCLATGVGTVPQLPQPDTRQLLAAAWQQMQNGDLAGADHMCRQVLGVRPNDPDALHLSGLIAAQGGRLDDAILLVGRACTLAPKHPAFRINLGNLHMQRSAFAKAEVCYRAALAIDPTLGDVHNNLGNAVVNQGRQMEAEACFRRAIKLDRNISMAWVNLANLLIEKRDWEDARQTASDLLQREPRNALAHYALGLIEKSQGAREAAEIWYRKALSLQPGLPLAHSDLGDVLMATRRMPEAEASYREAIRLAPGLLATRNNLALALQDQGRLGEAMRVLREVLQQNPHSSELLVNYGNLCKEYGDFEAAIASYREAARLQPANSDAWDNLLFVLNYLQADPAAVYGEHRRWGEMVEAATPALASVNAVRKPGNDGRLRIGYVSGDFKRHAAAYFLEPLLAHHDHRQFEIHCFQVNALSDDVTDRLRSHADHWHRIVAVSDAEAAELVRRLGIDILIDLSGHTAGSRPGIFVLKPAPIQISWLGYANTSGLSRIDYLVSDSVSSPPDDSQCFTEELLRLPEVRLCYRPPEYLPDVAPLPALARGFVTFGCFNNINKLNPQVLALWARILVRIPDAELRLKSKFFADAETRARVQGVFAGHGVDAGRLHLSPHSPHPAMLAEYSSIDIALDPFPYSGGVTTCDALWCGVPVLTLAGNTLYARQSASFLAAAGLDGWIAKSEDEYLEAALAFSADMPALSVLRSRLREQVSGSPVGDGARFARHFEAMLRQCAERQVDADNKENDRR